MLAINSETVAARLSIAGASKPLESSILRDYWTPVLFHCKMDMNGTIPGFAWKNATVSCTGVSDQPMHDAADRWLHALPVFADYDSAASLSPLLSAVGANGHFVPVGVVGELKTLDAKPAVAWHST